MEHELKCWPAFFERLVDGSKTFEVRKDDRGYQRGDTLHIREWDKGKPVPGHVSGDYTGREARFEVGFVLRSGPGFVLPDDFVVMSLLPASPDTTEKD